MIAEDNGLIHEELDLKVLILYVLRRLPGEVEPETLFEICGSDAGVQYFDYMTYLQDLVATGHVEETDFGYRITQKGEDNVDAVESGLPFTVRAKADLLIEPESERLARLSMITAEREAADGGYRVHLALSDGIGEILNLNLFCADEKQAVRMKRNFRRHAEEYYSRISEILSEDPKRIR